MENKARGRKAPHREALPGQGEIMMSRWRPDGAGRPGVRLSWGSLRVTNSPRRTGCEPQCGATRCHPCNASDAGGGWLGQLAHTPARGLAVPSRLLVKSTRLSSG